ncbi:MAG: hypothetical protein AB7P69_08340 [Candidatus Binatia bacterium]
MKRFYNLLLLPLLCVVNLSRCAFPPPVRTTVPALLENPVAYRYERLEVAGTVEWGGGEGHPDFPYWHFHLKNSGANIVCYSAAYKHQVLGTIDLLIRKAEAEKREISVTGYLGSWGADRVVLRLEEVTYEGHSYNAEFLPPAVSVGF